MTLRNYLLNKQLKRSDFMNSITVEKLVYKNFGECLKLSNGIVEALYWKVVFGYLTIRQICLALSKHTKEQKQADSKEPACF